MRKGLKILVAYDESEHAKKALSEAADLANAFSGSISVLNCAWDCPTRALWLC